MKNKDSQPNFVPPERNDDYSDSDNDNKNDGKNN